MLPANKTTDPVEEAALYQRCFERERRARQQAEAVLEAKSLDLFMQHQELLQVNSTLEQRIQERTAELAAAVKQAEKASSTKSEFLAKMSHEIRTPMNGVLGMLEALSLTALDNRQKELLNVARDSADSLLSLINDILDFSKIEAGRLGVESINFDLTDLLDSIIQLWTPRAAEKKLELSLYIDPDTPRWLVGDPTRLSQIVTNLISNALKFTTQGRISIQCDVLTPEGMDPCMLRFSVQDTGVGMSEDVCKRLFTAFEQADGAATSRVYGGTGLGLAICKQLAQLMDGEITAESTPGSGSCFVLILPFNIGVATVTETPVAAMSQPEQCSKHHLLVVDDNETNRRVALAILEHLGFTTSFAADGQEAVNMIQNGSSNFSMILMDCHMPVMDGHEATQSIRAWERATDRKRTPIVAVSASAFQEDRDNCAKSGMDDFIPKPVTLKSLQDAITKWLSASTNSSTQSVAMLTTPPEKSVSDSSSKELPEHLFDLEQFNEMKMITGAQFAPLLEKFFIDSKLQIKGMREAAQANDAESMRKCSHKLKGSSGSIGAKVLSKVCHRLEDRARSGNIDGADEAVESIDMCLDEVIVALRQNIAA